MPPSAERNPTFPKPPARRVYVHATCGRATVVDGDHYAGLCNPFVGPFGVQTLCTSCRAMRPLDEFAWQDTRERLDHYRRRVKLAIPAWALLSRYLVRAFCLVGLPALGAFAGEWFSGGQGYAWPAVGLVAGLLVGVVGAGIAIVADPRDYRLYR